MGFTGQQVNCPDPQTAENQLARYTGLGILKGFDHNSPPQPLAAATNAQASVEYRVRSFMQANCAQCHFPGNPIIARWDARFQTSNT